MVKYVTVCVFARICAIVCLIAVLLPCSVYSQRVKSSQSAGEQRKAEKGLKDNERFFYYVNFSVSNGKVKEELTVCRKAILYDMFAKFLYMKFKFKDSYEHIRKAQENLIVVYRMVVSREIHEGKMLLDEVSPKPIMKNDALSKHYCNLGYTNNEQAKIFVKMADSYKESLYSLRLYKYIQALKKAKQAKRYAVLAYITFNSADKGTSYIHDIKLKDSDNEVYIYSYLKKYIEALQDENDKRKWLRVLDDCYYKLIDDYSFYQEVWDTADLRELPEYEEYIRSEE